MKLSAAFHSDRGRRTANEDAAVVEPGLGCVLVADGLGGAPSGEVASRMAVEAVLRHLRAELPPGSRLAPSYLSRLIGCVNGELHAEAERVPGLQGMGTTLDVVVVRDGRYLLGHVGDSRVHLARRGEIRLLTSDHTLVQQRLEAGLLSPEEARFAPDRSIVTRALGTDPYVRADVGSGDVLSGDLFILTTDGVHGVLSAADILAVTVGLAVTTAAERLVEAALAAGSTDNATAALLGVEL